jgi:hypothetical protein
MIGGARLSFVVGCHRLVEAEVSCYNRAWHQLPSQTRDYMAPPGPGTEGWEPRETRLQRLPGLPKGAQGATGACQVSIGIWASTLVTSFS